MTPTRKAGDAANTAEAALVRDTAAFHAARDAAEAARKQLADTIVSALLAGVPLFRTVEATGYTREHIRRITRAAGVRPIARTYVRVK